MIVVLKDPYGMSLKMRVILITLLQLVNSDRNKDDLKLFCFYQASMIAESVESLYYSWTVFFWACH